MAAPSNRRKEPHDQLAFLNRQTWHLWGLSLTVTALLAIAIAVFFYPAIQWHVLHIDVRHVNLSHLIAGLLTLVFLQSLYIVKKQRDLNELRDYIISSHAEALLNRDAFPRDSLTGVLDRRVLPDVLKREINWVDRYRIPLSLVLFDIRGFGEINEKRGNLMGDLVLKDLAGAIQATVRQTDSVLRYGSDEFLCLLTRTDLAGSHAFTRRVEKACRDSARLRDIILDSGNAIYEAGRNANAVLADAERDLAQRREATRGSATEPQKLSVQTP